MSLINKMLQDLDARAGQPGAAGMPSDIRPAATEKAAAPAASQVQMSRRTPIVSRAAVVTWLPATCCLPWP